MYEKIKIQEVGNKPTFYDQFNNFRYNGEHSRF